MEKKITLSVAVVIAIIIGVWQYNVPRNYEDCVLANMKSAQNIGASGVIAKACQAKFPSASNPYDQFDRK